MQTSTDKNDLRIGVTIGLHSATETIWNNGIKQNAVFLSDVLRRCDNVANVILVNTTAIDITDALPWDLSCWPTQPFETAKDQLDVLIELGGQISAEQTAYLKEKNCKIVSYCCGSEYVAAAESMVFDRPQWERGLFINQQYDAIWMIPQIEELNRAYFEILRRCAARTVPFVWSPVFLEGTGSQMPGQGQWMPQDGCAKRLSIMEPNLSLLKFCLYPIFIAELAYRKKPDAIALLQVTNAEHFATKNIDFIACMNQLDIVRQQKSVFVGRYDTPRFLADHTDIVISHQWGNPLNYFYLEVCWQGYPLVHNAHLCRELGFYYPEQDVGAGSEQLLQAMAMPASQSTAYRHQQRSHIARFLTDQPSVVAQYTALLQTLVNPQ